MAVYEVPPGYRIALVATMPRSGTWYSFYFFDFLDLFLSGRSQLNTRLDLHVYDALKLGKLHTHCIAQAFSKPAPARGEVLNLLGNLEEVHPFEV